MPHALHPRRPASRILTPVLVAVALAALLQPGAAAAAVDRYTVSAAHFDFELLPAHSTLVDVNGVYGEAGRVLSVVDLRADLDGTAAGNEALITDEDIYSLSIEAAYVLSYALADQNGERVGEGRFDVRFRQWGWAGREAGSVPLAGNGHAPAGAIFAPSTPTGPVWDNFRIDLGLGDFPRIVGEWTDPLTGADDGGRLTFADNAEARTATHLFGLAPAFGGGYLEGVSTGYIVLTPVPEPESYALLALGLGAVALARRRMRR